MAEKVGKDYWERVWQPAELPRQVQPQRDTLRNHSYHEFHRLFSRLIPAAPGADLIEFGCAQSTWLSYFGGHGGMRVTGIDYAPRGCEKARAVLARDGVAGEIVQADFLDPPERLLGAFDVGISFGVAEHFEDTAECLAAFRRFLKPGGVLITVIPNLAGVTGWIQRWLDREIYDIHVVLDASALADAHRRAGLDPLDCRYLVCSNFGMLTLGEQRSPLKRLLRLGLMGISMGLWIIDRSIVRLPVTRLLSPYVVCAARTPLT